MELLIALFSLSLLIWLIPIVRSGRFIVFALMILVTGTVFGPSFFAIEGPIQISIDRVLWFVTLGLVVLGSRSKSVQFPTLTRADWLLAALVGWCFVRALGGQVPASETPPLARWFFYIAMPAGMYLVARVVTLRQSDIRWLVKAVIGLSVYLTVIAVMEVTGWHGLIFPRFITDPEIWEFYGRGRGPLLNPAGNGIVIGIGLCAAVVCAIYSKSRIRIVYGMLAVVLLAGVYATLTRSVWLGAVASLGIIGLVYAPRWIRVLGLVSMLLFGGASMMGLRDQLVSMKRDKNLSAEDAAKSISLRPLLAVVAWDMFLDRPITGHGFGQYVVKSRPYYSDRSYELPLEEARGYSQHNVFLSVLVDTGLIGIVAMFGWLGALAITGWQLARGCRPTTESRWVGILVIGGLVHFLCNGMFHDVMIIPMVHMFLFFIAGIGVNVFQSGLLTKARIRSAGVDAKVSAGPAVAPRIAPSV